MRTLHNRLCLLALLLSLLGMSCERSNVAYREHFKPSHDITFRVKGDTLVAYHESFKEFDLLDIHTGRQLSHFKIQDRLNDLMPNINAENRFEPPFVITDDAIFWRAFDTCVGNKYCITQLDLASGKIAQRPLPHYAEVLYPVPGNTKQIAVLSDSLMMILDAATLQVQLTHRWDHAPSMMGLNLHPLGLIITSNHLSTTTLISSQTGIPIQEVCPFTYPGPNVPNIHVLADGRHLIATDGTAIVRADILTPSRAWTRYTTRIHERSILLPNDRLLVLLQGGTLAVLDCKTGDQILNTGRYACGGNGWKSIAASEDGKRIAMVSFCGDRSGIAVIDAATLEEETFIVCAPDLGDGPWFKDDLLIAFERDKGDIIAWRLPD
jgi:hypothetical protein